MRTPTPRSLPGRDSPSDPFPALARRIAALPAASLAAAIEKALRDAHRAGLAAAAPSIPEAERVLLAEIGAVVSDSGEATLVQPLGPCPGMPWQLEASGRAVLDASGFAAQFPDAAVQGLLARGALAADPSGTLSPGPRFPGVSRAAETPAGP